MTLEEGERLLSDERVPERLLDVLAVGKRTVPEGDAELRGLALALGDALGDERPELDALSLGVVDADCDNDGVAVEQREGEDEPDAERSAEPERDALGVPDAHTEPLELRTDDPEPGAVGVCSGERDDDAHAEAERVEDGDRDALGEAVDAVEAVCVTVTLGVPRLERDAELLLEGVARSDVETLTLGDVVRVAVTEGELEPEASALALGVVVVLTLVSGEGDAVPLRLGDDDALAALVADVEGDLKAEKVGEELAQDEALGQLLTEREPRDERVEDGHTDTDAEAERSADSVKPALTVCRLEALLLTEGENETDELALASQLIEALADAQVLADRLVKADDDSDGERVALTVPEAERDHRLEAEGERLPEAHADAVVEGSALRDALGELLAERHALLHALSDGLRDTVGEGEGERETDGDDDSVRLTVAEELCDTVGLVVRDTEGDELSDEANDKEEVADGERSGDGVAEGDIDSDGHEDGLAVCKGERLPLADPVTDRDTRGEREDELQPLAVRELLAEREGAGLPLVLPHAEVLLDTERDCDDDDVKELSALPLRDALAQRDAEGETVPVGLMRGESEALGELVVETLSVAHALAEAHVLSDADTEAQPEDEVLADGEAETVALPHELPLRDDEPLSVGLTVEVLVADSEAELQGESEGDELVEGDADPERELEPERVTEPHAVDERVPLGLLEVERLALGEEESRREAVGDTVALPERDAEPQAVDERVPLGLLEGEWLALAEVELQGDCDSDTVALPVRDDDAHALDDPETLGLRLGERLSVGEVVRDGDGEVVAVGRPVRLSLGDVDGEELRFAERLSLGERDGETLTVPLDDTEGVREGVELPDTLRVELPDTDGVGDKLLVRDTLGEPLKERNALHEEDALVEGVSDVEIDADLVGDTVGDPVLEIEGDGDVDRERKDVREPLTLPERLPVTESEVVPLARADPDREPLGDRVALAHDDWLPEGDGDRVPELEGVLVRDKDGEGVAEGLDETEPLKESVAHAEGDSEPDPEDEAHLDDDGDELEQRDAVRDGRAVRVMVTEGVPEGLVEVQGDADGDALAEVDKEAELHSDADALAVRKPLTVTAAVFDVVAQCVTDTEPVDEAHKDELPEGDANADVVTEVLAQDETVGLSDKDAVTQLDPEMLAVTLGVTLMLRVTVAVRDTLGDEEGDTDPVEDAEPRGLRDGVEDSVWLPESDAYPLPVLLALGHVLTVSETEDDAVALALVRLVREGAELRDAELHDEREGDTETVAD